MKKVILVFALMLSIVLLSACNENKSVIIYTNSEDFRIEKLDELLKKEYPNIKVSIQYFSTGTLAAKVKAEGKNIEADIIWGVDIANAAALEDNFADLSGYDTSAYLYNMVPTSKKYHVWSKEAGCIILNTKVLESNNLPEPTSYQDLLNIKYKNLIMMPNPKSSGTGYFFLNSLVANWGEETAFNYFKDLNNYVKQFSESGSGPVKALDKGEIAIGLGMTYQAVLFASKNPDLKITYFNEGSPYNLYTSSIVKGKENKSTVTAIYSYMFEEYFQLDKELFNPEIIYKNQTITMENYPKNIIYSKMEQIDSYVYKEYLLDKWAW